MHPRRLTHFLLLLGLAALAWSVPHAASSQAVETTATTYAGSKSCRDCHERFYQLWATSYHGLAMQPYDASFAARELAPQEKAITIGERRYRADIEQACVIETTAEGETRLPMVHVLGGKNVYYFLTPLDKGRLQTLPLAFDVHSKQWFDTAASGLRHAGDQAVDWRDPAYTFNTSCHGCHVSQFNINYNAKTDVYNTTWTEPGINCETCHGPSAEHNAVCAAAPKGTVPADLKIIRGGRDFTQTQNNDTCSICHAKMEPITASYFPGEPFFDHYDLITLENPDFYPDGRDLGENYTFTSWRMSPCVRSSRLDCLHCHTSSGRFRQKDAPNTACLPCHADLVADPEPHTHHPAASPGGQCISCHMPKTTFARMERSDHSMRPPAPAATIRFGSPNACTTCHADKSPEWADAKVRQWRTRDYQAVIIHNGELIEAARQHDFTRLPEMLAAVTAPDRDEIVANSLLRLLAACEDQRKWPAVIAAGDDTSPLVRASAVAQLADLHTQEGLKALLAATSDSVRLVRIRAAISLAGFAPALAATPPTKEEQAALVLATQELMQSFSARPDLWNSHYNLGNYLLLRGEPKQASAAYEQALDLEPRSVMAHVNLAMAQARLGDNAAAAASLTQALAIEPDNATARFNLALLQAEQGDSQAAQANLRKALEIDPAMHQAAYNLCVLVGEANPAEAVSWCQRAYQLRPSQKYGQALAYFRAAAGQKAAQ